MKVNMVMKTEILKQDLKMLNVALECYMGNDLEEDSNLSRPVKQALKDFEEAINDLELYKKAFEKSCSVHIYTCIAHDLLSTNEGESGNITYVEEFENKILEQAQEELGNGK